MGERQCSFSSRGAHLSRKSETGMWRVATRLTPPGRSAPGAAGAGAVSSLRGRAALLSDCSDNIVHAWRSMAGGLCCCHDEVVQNTVGRGQAPSGLRLQAIACCRHARPPRKTGTPKLHLEIVALNVGCFHSSFALGRHWPTPKCPPAWHLPIKTAPPGPFAFKYFQKEVAHPSSALGRHWPPMSATCAAVTSAPSSAGLARLAAAAITPACFGASPCNIKKEAEQTFPPVATLLMKNLSDEDAHGNFRLARLLLGRQADNVPAGNR